MSQALLQWTEPVAAGQVLRVRLLIRHPMETGYLQDLSGQPIARNVIRELRCRYAGQEVFRAEPSPGIAAQPLFEFHLRVRASAEVLADWVDDRGERGEVRRWLAVQG